MIPLYSVEEIKKFDSFCINKLGIPSLILMENAAESIFQSITSSMLFDAEIDISIICGKGNNGGDGFALARKLSQTSNNVYVFHLFDETEFTEDAKINFKIIKNIANGFSNVKIIKVNSVKDLVLTKKCDIVIDAILGSGSKGELEGLILDTVKYLNKLNSYKIAIDIPTGVNGDTGSSKIAFESDLTVSLGGLKKGLFTELGSSKSGHVVYGSIGIEPIIFNNNFPNTLLTEPEVIKSYLPKKEKNINKYKSGKVLTIAGSGEYPGAGILSAKAPYYCGTGASILVYPEEFKNLAIKKSKEIVVHSYKNENNIFNINVLNNISERIKWADVVVIGPGLGRNKETEDAIIEFYNNRNNKLTVIDADGLYPFRENKYKNFNLSNTVLTPHLGEFSQMINISVEEIKNNIFEIGKDFSTKTKSILVLKGAPTQIFSPNGISYINSTGNEGLAKFGSGDVLTGIIGGFISQKKDEILNSVLLSVYIHGLCADLLKEKKSVYSFTASDLIKIIPEAIKKLLNNYD